MDSTPTLVAGALAAIVVCAIAAKRFALPYPIVFVLAGSALAFVPNVPVIAIDPRYIFLIVLPPLLFNGGWSTDWRLLRDNVRPVLLLAVGLVFVTTAAVALAAHAAGFDWATAFVLGAIVSPPDAVAASAIFERFSLPRRIVAILSGEGLINDGTALVIYRFAVAAVVTGAFSAPHAAMSMIVVAAGGVAAGLAVGLAVEGLTRLMSRGGLADSLIDNLVFLLAPYAAYLGAESVGVSGVLATVAAGVYVSRKSSLIYEPDTRLVGAAVWQLLDYLLNGFVFLLIGLQVRAIVRDPGFVAREIAVGALVSAVAIVVRIAWVFPATWLPRWLSPSLRRRDPIPSWRFTSVIAWTGLRGIISLAAALALPLRTQTGPFPHRNDIIFITFCVILATLVGQGLLLTPLLAWLRIESGEDTAVREMEVRVLALRAGLERIADLERRHAYAADERSALERIRAEYEHRIEHLQNGHGGQESPASRFDHQLQDEALDAERREIRMLRENGRIPDDIYRRIEYDLDLAETRLT